MGIKEIAKKLDRSHRSVAHKAICLGLISNNVKPQKTHDQYVAELAEKCPSMKVIEPYNGDGVAILHKCLICDIQSKYIPTDRLQGNACRFCHGINQDLPGITYLVYFPKINLYKVGVTGKTTQERNSSQGYEYEIILEHKFDTGREALQFEEHWLDNIKEHKFNTGLLNNGGNTETFRYDY